MPSKSYKARREQTVRDAVVRIWPLFRKAPPPFTGYKAAERYLAQKLASQQFDYGIDENATIDHAWAIKSRVHHQFVREAVTAGMFVVDSEVQQTQETELCTSPADVSDFYASTARDVKQVESLISQWPPSFSRFADARKWVKNLCAERGFVCTKVPGKTPSATRGFVSHTVANNAHEAGKFVLTDQNDPHYIPKPIKIASPRTTATKSAVRPASSMRSMSSTSIFDTQEDVKVPSTLKMVSISKQEDVQPTVTLGFKSVAELDEAYLAARFELAEQMLSRLGLHAVDKKAREMETEIAKAEENPAKMGIEVGGERTALLE